MKRRGNEREQGRADEMFERINQALSENPPATQEERNIDVGILLMFAAMVARRFECPPELFIGQAREAWNNSAEWLATLERQAPKA